MGLLHLLIGAAALTGAAEPSDVVMSEGSPPDATNLQVEFVCGANRLQAEVETSLKGGGKISHLRWNGRDFPPAVLGKISAELAPMYRVGEASARCNSGTIRVLVGGLIKPPTSGSDDILVEFTVSSAGLTSNPRTQR